MNLQDSLNEKENLKDQIVPEETLPVNEQVAEPATTEPVASTPETEPETTVEPEVAEEPATAQPVEEAAEPEVSAVEEVSEVRESEDVAEPEVKPEVAAEKLVLEAARHGVEFPASLDTIVKVLKKSRDS